MSPRDRLIVALDQEKDEALPLVRRLGDSVTFYKVGWVTLMNGGVELVRELLGLGKNVFLDLKIFDVPRTVREAISTAASLGEGIRFATVHGVAANIQAAREGREGTELQVLAVTALTSLTEEDIREMYGVPKQVSIEQHVVNVATRLVVDGCDGVIASPQEVRALRAALPGKVLIVTPGIRLPDDSVHDQRRTGTPFDSIRAGADYVVVGRSIYQNPNPSARVEQYVHEIERGLAAR